MSTKVTSVRTWRVPRLPLEDWTFIAMVGWGAMLVGLVATGFAIDHWAWIAEKFGREVDDTTITWSIWGPISGVAAWFVGFTSGYYLHNLVTAFVAAGRTRRDSAIEAAIFGGALVAISAVLVTIGFVLERMLYAFAGWERGSTGELMFVSYNDSPMILLTSLCGGLMWMTGGALIGSSFYRSHSRGALGIVVALVAVSLAGGNNGFASPLMARRLDIAADRPVTLLLMVVLSVVMGGLTWLNVRDVPLRSR